MAAENGEVGHIGGITSRYRQHHGGSWSPLTPMKRAQNSSTLFGYLEAHFGDRYEQVIRETRGHILWSYMSEAMQSRDWKTARKLFWMSLPDRFSFLLRHAPLDIPRVLGKVYLPAVFSPTK